ncbi:MAG: class I tRNA ligase family protein, partial [Bacteroidota bacterium]|nr:class I tRNA ligase family protein [Bacteroidota bacterium]
YSKADKQSIVELGAIFKETLKMISPFMPFIADHLYHKLSPRPGDRPQADSHARLSVGCRHTIEEW